MATNKGLFVTYKPSDRIVLQVFYTLATANAGKGVGESVKSITTANFNAMVEPGWTVSTAGVLAPPAQPAATNAEKATAFKVRVGTAAYLFDEHYHSHWAVHGFGNKVRQDTTSKHFRSWIGYCWEMVDKYARGREGAPTETQVNTLLGYLDAEVSTGTSVKSWNVAHSSAAWVLDTKARRVTSTATRGAVGTRRATAGTEAIWTMWCKNKYAAALTYNMKSG